MTAPRRRSSLSRSLQQGDSQRSIRRPSLTASVRRSSQNTMNEINVTLGRSIITEEAPTNKKERRERRNSRKEDYARIKDVRSDRMGAVKDQWESHRKSFVSEEEELEKLVTTHGKSYWTCCGATLCCGW